MAIYLEGNRLTFDFSDYHPEARMSIDFQRTLRIPDDGKRYPLPPGVGRFPIRHVEDYASRLPNSWVRRGGVLLPMYQAEAMWVCFSAGDYPFAVKIAAGKINAITGERWSLGLNRDPQDYVVVPSQPWLDGFCVEKGVIRQFVAMPLGKGYTAEEQVTAETTWGGLQVAVYPIKRNVHVQRQRQARDAILHEMLDMECLRSPMADMGLAPGGRMTQEIYEDNNELSDWDQRKGERCFIAILNSEDWQRATGEPVPNEPASTKEYAEAGLPWFDYYSDRSAVAGSGVLASLQGIGDRSKARDQEIAEINDAIPIARVIKLGSTRRGEVRSGHF